MLDIDIQNTLFQLTQSIGLTPLDIKSIAESGSARRYYRVVTAGRTLIGTYNANVEENEAFFYLSAHFGALGLPVPTLLAVSESRECYLQTDHGDQTLFHHVQQALSRGRYDEDTIALFRQVLEQLVLFQIEGHRGLDYGKVYPVPCFDASAVTDDLDYFKYYFVKPHAEIVFNENRLKAEFSRLSTFLAQAPNDFFMYRDFQSRNVMVDHGKPYFIDYQGGRRGPLQYDVISLLFQVKAQMPQSLRDELLEHYKAVLSEHVDLQRLEFDRYYPYFVHLRLMQVLGAYGFRGLIQKKSHFLESIPYALKELTVWSQRHPLDGYPELQGILVQLASLQQRYPMPVPSSTLTVTVNSFSFKKGYPSDFSGNGGGFVFDCRALPNPGREPQFKTKTGRDWEVVEYLNEKPQTHVFLDHVKGIVQQSVDNYLERHFSHLMLSFGCTGGQHRSVFFAQSIADWIRDNYPTVIVRLNHIEQKIHE
ncbi:MAG: phosphotransferase [Bacteroidales bacterium]|nr:phosphotransferase [Bacteroidales bacterium]